MKKTASVIFSALMLLPILCTLISCASEPKPILHASSDVGYIRYAESGRDFDIRSPQAFVYDCDRNEILFAKGMDKVVYPASTTKLLTILYSLTLLDPEEKVTPGDELLLVAADSSVAYIKSYHTLTVEMLVEGMLLPSGNDAAYALAAAAGRKSSKNPDLSGRGAIDVFVKGLGDYARSIGCVGTHFTTPDGYAGKEHYSTLEDLILISSLAAENPIICRYCALAADDVTYASGHTNRWVNTNQMLDPESPYYAAEVNGLKTGSIDGSYHLIATAEADGRHYIIGTFGAHDKDARFADTKAIVEELFG